MYIRTGGAQAPQRAQNGTSDVPKESVKSYAAGMNQMMIAQLRLISVVHSAGGGNPNAITARVGVATALVIAKESGPKKLTAT